MTAPTFVITRPFGSSGLGCNLLSMVGALHLCERTGRSLIVDWTGMEELKDPATNYFVAFFEPLRRWRSVDIFYVNDPDDPSKSVQYAEADVFRPGHEQYRDLLTRPVDHRYVLLQPFHYRIFDQSGLSTAALFHYTKAFYDQLTPRSHIRARLAALAPLFANRIVVGLNVRTGNGQFGPTGKYRNRVNMSIFERGSFLGRIRRACEDCLSGFPPTVTSERAVFVVTDCAEMQETLLKVPHAFAVRTRFPPSGAGHQFADFDANDGYSDVDSVNETVVDMLLLAQCHGLACNYTEYNRYAQYKTTFFNGNVKNIERYFESPAKRIARPIWRRIRRAGP